jgi:uncharacterized protein
VGFKPPGLQIGISDTQMLMLDVLVFFAFVSLGASFVNGAIGYGYSSISTPLALLVLVNRVVNPAYVLLEAMVNTVMAIISGKKNLKAVFRRTAPIMLGVAPAAVIGTYILYELSYSANFPKFIVYAAILPLILLQAAGLRKQIKRESAAGVPLGFGIGLLYSITTISGPPIALFYNNQGFKKQEFKAAISLVRITESYITCIAYYFFGFFSMKPETGWFGSVTFLQLFEIIAPPVLIGLPLGVLVVRKMNVNTFPRVAMTFNALIVDYGLTRVIVLLYKVNINIANLIFAVVAAIAVGLLYKYFHDNKVAQEPLTPLTTLPQVTTQSPAAVPEDKLGSSS